MKPDGRGEAITIDLPHGYSAEVEYVHRGDAGNEVRFGVGHASWNGPERLGYDGAHFALPAFRWQELTLLDAAITRHAGADSAAASCLLLFPGAYVASDEEGNEARQQLADWWHDLPYVRVKDVSLLAASAAAYRRVDVRWRIDEALGWINDSPYSFRNPKSAMPPFSERRFACLREFLAAMDRIARSAGTP